MTDNAGPMGSSHDSQSPLAALDYVERRPQGQFEKFVSVTGRWIVRLLVLLVLAIIVHLLVTAKAIEWGQVWHYLSVHSILMGAITTVELTAIGMAIGVVLGAVLALMRLSSSVMMNTAASLYIWVFRGTPLLVQILFWFNLASFIPRITLGVPFGGPVAVSWNTNSVVTVFVAAVVALGLNQAAYMCEIIRAGILSVEEGQMEASLALGMTHGRAMRRIILPQAMRVIIPPTGNNAIALLKDSSLVSVISMTDLLYAAQTIYSQNFETIPLLVVASIWYLIMSSVLSVGQVYVERHFGRGTTRNPPPSLFQTFSRNVTSILRPRGGDSTVSA